MLNQLVITIDKDDLKMIADMLCNMIEDLNSMYQANKKDLPQKYLSWYDFIYKKLKFEDVD